MNPIPLNSSTIFATNSKLKLTRRNMYSQSSKVSKPLNAKENSSKMLTAASKIFFR